MNKWVKRLEFIKPIYHYHKVLLEIALAVVSILSLQVSFEALKESKEANKIAQQSYKKALADAEAQKSDMEASRKALQTVAEVVQKNLELYRNEIEEVRKEKSRHPNLEIDINGIPMDTYLGKEIRIMVKDSVSTIKFQLKNTGTAPWKTPLLLILAPDSIRIWQPNVQSSDEHKLMISWPYPSIPPIKEFGSPFEAIIRVAPGKFERFELQIEAKGEGTPAKHIIQIFKVN